MTKAVLTEVCYASQIVGSKENNKKTQQEKQSQQIPMTGGDESDTKSGGF